VLLLDDGRLVLDVESIGPRIHLPRARRGTLSNNKGINRQGGGLSAPALTDKDRDDIKLAAEFHADYVAVSFPKSGADIRQARELLAAAGSDALIIAKIERVEAIAALEEILEAADAIMVARGDLAVEVGDAAVPALQKRMIRVAREHNKVVITATQMMESMISSPVPTRAEVSDVANAVLDGTDAVMLSAETAAGKYPVETIEAMARICVEAEKSEDDHPRPALPRPGVHRASTVDRHGRLFTAFPLKVKAIAALTQSGSTALWMSRINAACRSTPLTPEIRSRYRMTSTATFPLLMRYVGHDREEALREAEEELIRAGAVQPGETIVLTVGRADRHAGRPTNPMKIVRVGENNYSTGRSSL